MFFFFFIKNTKENVGKLIFKNFFINMDLTRVLNETFPKLERFRIDFPSKRERFNHIWKIFRCNRLLQIIFSSIISSICLGFYYGVPYYNIFIFIFVHIFYFVIFEYTNSYIVIIISVLILSYDYYISKN